MVGLLTKDSFPIALMVIGLLCFGIGLILYFLKGVFQEKDVKTAYGTLIMIGPLPIVISNDSNLAKMLFFVGILLALIIFVFLALFKKL